MEGSAQLVTVLPFAASVLHSRRCPAVESVVGALQPAFTGKYYQYQTPSLPDRHSVCRPCPTASTSSRIVSSSTSPALIGAPSSHNFSRPSLLNPGRPTSSSMEAPDPPSSVAPSGSTTTYHLPLTTRSCHPSRPGPESSAGDGVFQAAIQGMYTTRSVNSRPDEYSPLRSVPRGDDTAQPASNVLIYYQNVGGINTSIAEYQLALSNGCYDAYAFTETWLNEGTSSNQLFDNSFSVYRHDRSPLNSNKTTGGGVLLAVRSRFKSRLVSPPNCASVEQLWVAISTDDATIFVCVVYIPPDRINDADVIETHINLLNWVVSQLEPKDNVVILGDFNLSSIAWQCSSFGFFFPCTTRSSMGQTSRELLDAYSTAGLRQMVGVKNENNRSLDLFFVSEELGVNCSVMHAPAPLVKICRHHPPLLMCLEASPSRTFHDTSESVSYDFSRANFGEMNVFLERVNWDEILSGSDANLAASTLSGVLLYAIDQFVPVISKREPTKPAWSNAALKNLKRAKQAALRRHSKYRTDTTRASYLEANTAYKHLNDSLYSAHLSRLQSRLKTNPKSFWRHVNDQRKESGLPTTMTDGFHEADTTTAIVDLFRSQFSSVFVNEQLDPQDVTEATRNVPSFPASGVQFAITNDVVIAAAKDLKS
ncbi:uncharacterized protein LOC134290735 [Aedes albopictus]|uniref:Endonuclease/exonuclease/phosphatase domain-containing protein n=1 Tax=Aedes albopictus TaxID=7160 RepID=A0ABM1XX83_AEDAL